MAPTARLDLPSRPICSVSSRVTQAQHDAIQQLAADLDATVSAVTRLALARGLAALAAEQRNA